MCPPVSMRGPGLSPPVRLRPRACSPNPVDTTRRRPSLFHIGEVPPPWLFSGKGRFLQLYERKSGVARAGKSFVIACGYGVRRSGSDRTGHQAPARRLAYASRSIFFPTRSAVPIANVPLDRTRLTVDGKDTLPVVFHTDDHPALFAQTHPPRRAGPGAAPMITPRQAKERLKAAQ